MPSHSGRQTARKIGRPSQRTSNPARDPGARMKEQTEMGERGYRVGLGQILVEGGRPAVSLDRAVGVIAEAPGRGGRLVVLPECLDLGWADPTARDLARPIPGPS